jgi:hypothetical protein
MAARGPTGVGRDQTGIPGECELWSLYCVPAKSFAEREMIHFNETERAVYYPQDRRFRIWIRPAVLVLLIVLALVPLILAWLQAAFWGLPNIASNPASASGTASGPHGFPFWIRWCHFFNLLFTFMLIRSGLSILMDHPRLYFNEGCTPGTEWISFTPFKVPTDRIWTAGLLPYGGGCALLAFHQRIWFRAHRRLLGFRLAHQ